MAGNAVFLRSDATREDDVKAMINTAIERFGRIDVLFNNAGGGVTNDLVEDLSIEDFEGGMSYPESTEGGRRVSVLKRQEGVPVNLG